MKQITHLGAYGLIINDGKIVLIKKANGPYKGKLDLPGGTIEFGERPEETVIRELKEEVGIDVKSLTLLKTDSVLIEWKHKGNEEQIHHIGIIYKIDEYDNEILSNIELDRNNDDSLGAEFYEIDKLSKNNLSEIAFIALNKK